MAIKIILIIFSIIFLSVPFDLSIAPSMDYGFYAIIAYLSYIILWLIPVVYYLKKWIKIKWYILLVFILVNSISFIIIEYYGQAYWLMKKKESIDRAQLYQQIKSRQESK